jgi:hypothetical protein
MLVFKRAGAFPNLYCDFVAISRLAQELGIQSVDLTFRKVSGKFEAPYLEEVFKVLGIEEISESTKKQIEFMKKVYYDILTGKYKPRFGRILRFVARYFSLVKRAISDREARALYDYLRYIVGFTSEEKGWKGVISDALIEKLVTGRKTLKDVYVELIREIALSPKLELKDVEIKDVAPVFERIPDIEDLSYLIVDRKARTIFRHYYEPHLEKLRAGERIHLGRAYCVEEVWYDGDLNVVFRKARVFPTLYCDFLVLSMLAETLGARRINLKFKNISAQIVAPYFRTILERLGIESISEGSKAWIDYMSRVYRDAAIYLKVPRLGHLLKLIAFYYSTVEKRISRREARYLYYYFRKVANLKLWSERRCEDGYKVRLRLLSELLSNSSQ